MENAGSLSPGAEAGIAAGSIIAIIVVALIIKNNMNKKRVADNTEFKNHQRPMRMNSRENLIGRALEEGDAASELSHSRGLGSPALSYVLAPTTAVVNWGDSKSIFSASSSLIDLPMSRDGSSVSIPSMPKKPLPLRLSPSDTPDNGRYSNASSFGGIYMPPPPRSNRAFVSPLDVHFGRPTRLQGPTRGPQSSFPNLQFPEPAKIALLVPTPTDSLFAINSEAASVVSTSLEPPFPITPTFNFDFDTELLIRPRPSPRQSTRSIFPATSDDRPTSRRSAKALYGISTIVDTVHQGFLHPKSPGLTHYPVSDEGIVDDSKVKEDSVDIYGPIAALLTESSHHRGGSLATSSIYSLCSTITSRHASISEQPQNLDASATSRNHSRTRSTPSKRRSSSQTLSTFRNSIQRQSRHLSMSEFRRSRDRDTMHYNPISHHRNLNGSVQGRSVAFGHSRLSSFTNALQDSRLRESSVSTTLDEVKTPVPESSPEPEAPKPVTGYVRNLVKGLEVGIKDPDRLSVVTTASTRGRSASDTSQSSAGLGDFYDSYNYKRASQTSHLNLKSSHDNGSGRASNMNQDLHLENGVTELDLNGRMKKPPPSKFGNARLEGSVADITSPTVRTGLGIMRI